MRGSGRGQPVRADAAPRLVDHEMNRTRLGYGRWTAGPILLAAALLAAGAGCARLRPTPAPPLAPPRLEFEATAYSVTGTTAAGTHTGPGIVAADPTVLPLGSRIRVDGAGAYSGVYTVGDTGPAVTGREIDIFIPDDGAARRFGRRRVGVQVLERGAGRTR